MSVFLRRSLSSCLRYQHSASYSTTLPLRTQALEPQAAGSDAEPRKRKPRQPTTKDPLKKTRDRKPKKPAKPEEERPNLLEKTKVQDYLDFVASSNSFVTLEDIERIKPTKFARPGTPQYEEDYALAQKHLARSFSKDQLAQFLELYGLKPPATRTKQAYAASIIEGQWNWASPAAIKKMKDDRTQVKNESTLNPEFLRRFES